MSAKTERESDCWMTESRTTGMPVVLPNVHAATVLRRKSAGGRTSSSIRPPMSNPRRR